jgi:hypothetical protein
MPINFQAPIQIRDSRNGSWFWIHTHLWRDKRLSHSCKVIYGTLASYANQKQTAFPSVATVAEDSDTSERQVYRCLKQLEDVGYISVIREQGKPNLYTLVKTTPDIVSPLTASHPTPDKYGVGTPDKYGVLTIPIKQELINKTHTGSLAYLVSIPSEDRDQFIQTYRVNETQLANKAEDLHNYCNAHGKKYKDYRALMMNALNRDFGKRTIAPELLLDPMEGDEAAPLLEMSEEQLRKNREHIQQIKNGVKLKKLGV